MATKLHAGMVDGGHEVGDYTVSARASKARWLICQGQAVSRATYAALFSQIWTTFGVGDGSTTFNLPDPRGRALIMVGQGSISESLAAAAFNATTDRITVQENVDRWIVGMKVRFTTTGALPGGISAGVDYYINRLSATEIRISATVADAEAGNVIDITSAGTGTHTMTHTLTNRGIGERGGEETHALWNGEIPSHRHRLYGSATGSATPTGLADGGSRSISGNSVATGLAYADTNNGVPLVENTGGGAPHNNMPPFLAAGNLFIYAGV